MQGSGSFGVESILTSAVGEDDTLLIIANGAYGERMADIAEHAILNYLMYRVEYDRIPSADEVARLLSPNTRRSLMLRWYTVKQLPVF